MHCTNVQRERGREASSALNDNVEGCKNKSVPNTIKLRHSVPFVELVANSFAGFLPSNTGKDSFLPQEFTAAGPLILFAAQRLPSLALPERRET